MYNLTKGLLFAFSLIFFAVSSSARTGILSSVIGYDAGSHKRVIVRSGQSTYLSANASWELLNKSNAVVSAGTFTSWGKKWGDYWWIADFSGINTVGTYHLAVKQGGSVMMASDTFQINNNLLWDKTWYTVGITQGEIRAKTAYHKPGWQDCGGFMQEASSHASQLIGLEDVLEFGGNLINNTEKAKVIEQIKLGLGYLSDSQDTLRLKPFFTTLLGSEKVDGPLCHDLPIWMTQKRDDVITGDMPKAAVCWTRAARLLAASDPTLSAAWLNRAVRAFSWIQKNGTVTQQYGPSPSTTGGCGVGSQQTGHPEELMTTDLVMHLWAAVELYKAGLTQYKDTAAILANSLLVRQIPASSPEGPYYGHFRTYAGVACTWSEKAWTHDGAAYLLGQTFPHYLIPVVMALDLWPTHPDAAQWRQMLHDFAYGYFLPACNANPFMLLPQGYYKCPKEEGLLEWSGMWHGRNGSFGHAAALATEFERLFNDPAFGAIATGNLQWIAGLNSGLAIDTIRVSKQHGTESPLRGGYQLIGDSVVPVSQIEGIGYRYTEGWMGFIGTISNGFSADTQFQIGPPNAATDAPNFYNDEDWITHSGGWLSAIAYQIKKTGGQTNISRHAVLSASSITQLSVNLISNNQLVIKGDNLAGKLAISLYSISGKKLQLTRTVNVSGESLIIPCGHLPFGAYLVRITNNSQTYCKEITKF